MEILCKIKEFNNKIYGANKASKLTRKFRQPLGANWSQWANIFNEVPISNHLEQIGHNSLITLLPNQYHKVPKKPGANSMPGHDQEKVLPQKGSKVGVKLCGDHFDDDDILKRKIVSGKFYAYRRQRLASGALPKHYLDGSLGQEPKVNFPYCEQSGNLHSCCEVDGSLDHHWSANCNQFVHYHHSSCEVDESQGQETMVTSSICNQSGNLHSFIDVAKDSKDTTASSSYGTVGERKHSNSVKVADLELDDAAVKRLKLDHSASQKRYSRAMKKTRNVGAVLNIYGEPLTMEIIHPPTSDQFFHFESNSIAALMNLITNTGLIGRFRDADNLINNWRHGSFDPQPPPNYLTNLSEEIISNVTEVNLGVIAEKNLKNWDIEAQILGCAISGVKDFDMGPTKYHHLP
uniref:Uncharacterized protein n=1 Tax=Daphnia galeata TaxID=27404 RepID=A0A8J2WC59_9CRUS|nr:unnamed protein product [Daphnia galeata]